MGHSPTSVMTHNVMVTMSIASRLLKVWMRRNGSLFTSCQQEQRSALPAQCGDHCLTHAHPHTVLRGRTLLSSSDQQGSSQFAIICLRRLDNYAPAHKLL